MRTVATEQKNRIHPYKFNLWVAIGSMMMMFAGLTSAVIVKRNQAGWAGFEIPTLFWISTIVILLSSITMVMAVKAFKERNIKKHRSFFVITLLLGITFVALQIVGFIQLTAQGFSLNSNVAYSFLYVIVGVHALHVLGGIIALIVMNIKGYSNKVKQYSAAPIEVMGIYWHFVDVLWLYLLLFMYLIK
ncbi:MAG TPA: heme-copper oxidase subunit III [Ferruginibacter sp.]|nr:heme-copper oxidase subunit III [Ferruginibacter sp.]HRE63453.1 heme-copper oxidase subunit III [Ferruginibacter sp.]